MKNQKGSRTGTVLKRIFDFRKWIDYDRLKELSQYLLDGTKAMFVPAPKPVDDKSTSFTETMTALNLDEEELNSRAKGLYRLSILMCVAASGILGYAIYNIIYGSIKAVVVSVVVSLIGFVLAFRYHFWYFQIRERKLGCTFKEWYKQGFLGEK